MRFLLLVMVVALTMTEVSGGWWRRWRLKRWATNVWRRHSGKILAGAGLALLGRSIGDADQNGDGVLTRSELEQHMDKRDVDDLLDALDKKGEGYVKRDVLERLLEDASVHSQ